MAHEDKVIELMKVLKIADDKTIGEIMAQKGIWTAGTSARKQSNRAMRELSDLGKLEKCNAFYRVPGCKSEYSDHARLLTLALAEILKLPYNPTIYREQTFPNGLRSDAVVLLKSNKNACCFILEVCHSETYEYLKSKYNEWLRWKDALTTLSQLFGCNIPHFGFVTEGKDYGFTSLNEVLTMKGD
jgi:hypothetical protein